MNMAPDRGHFHFFKTMTNVSDTEIEKFSAIASKWWDKSSEFKTLHDINPIRLNWILSNINKPLKDIKLIDIGCGGGILTESLVSSGITDVTGIDLAKESITVAKLHSLESGLKINYLVESAEDHAISHKQNYDVVTCMELLEHVPNPQSLIEAISTLLKPGGIAFFSTINRNFKSYALAIVVAEYILGMVPKGTHNHSMFLKPSEIMRFARMYNLDLLNSTGFEYKPLTGNYELSGSLDINYMLAVIKHGI